MSPPLRTLVADRGDAGVRLDLVLRRHLRDVDAATRTRVQAWIEGGQVTVNGAPVRRSAARAALGDVVAVVLPTAKPRRAMAAEDAPLDVLYEDEHLLALDKPAGIVVHPTFKHAAGTIMNRLLARARAWPAGQRPSLVGRLDKLTSGIVLVAKTAAVHAALMRTTRPDSGRPVPAGARGRTARAAATLAEAPQAKDYLAVVYGRAIAARGAIDLRLQLDRRDRRRVVASAAAGAPSVTEFERLARVPARRAGLALMRCRLVTGRRHQIRAHLAARGWPIVGDPVYGGPSPDDRAPDAAARVDGPRWSAIEDPMLAAALRAFPRQALHAWRLAIVHPVTGVRLQVEAPVPRDIVDLLAIAGLDADVIS
jgi:23S rRNA pseudouridine1911/1915/1917 synthase